MKVENTYSCPAGIWTKLSEVERTIYNGFRLEFSCDSNYPPKSKGAMSNVEKSILEHNLAIRAVWWLQGASPSSHVAAVLTTTGKSKIRVSC